VRTIVGNDLQLTFKSPGHLRVTAPCLLFISFYYTCMITHCGADFILRPIFHRALAMNRTPPERPIKNRPQDKSTLPDHRHVVAEDPGHPSDRQGNLAGYDCRGEDYLHLVRRAHRQDALTECDSRRQKFTCTRLASGATPPFAPALTSTLSHVARASRTAGIDGDIVDPGHALYVGAEWGRSGSRSPPCRRRW